jgi:type IV pilus assembly protein PilA
MRSRSPTRAGFTLIELLIVVVIIGILAAIAVPKFQTTKGKAYFASMRSDLKNFSTAQEGYFYDHREYTAVLDSLAFTPSTGVTLVIDEATPSGWAATTTHPMSAPHLCRMFVGTATPIAPATVAGVVACE